MDQENLDKLQSLYGNYHLPVALIDMESFRVIWTNDKAKTDRPAFLDTGLFDMLNLNSGEIRDKLNRYGTAYHYLEPFPAISDGVIFIRYGGIAAAIPDVTAGFPQTVGELPISRMDYFISAMRGGVDSINISVNNINHLLNIDDPEIERLFTGIQRSNYRILRNMQNVTLLSRYLSGSLPLRKQRCNLNELCSALCLATQSICRNPIRINLTVPHDEVVTEIDVRLAERALLNILLNSLVYTRDGNGIDVTLSRARSQVVLTVRDRGAGIQKDNLARVKQPYFSCEPADDGAQRPGLGLGLPIASIFCYTHGGTLLIDSEYGQGTSVAMSFKQTSEGSDVFEPSIADYVTDTFSPVYIEMCDICEIPT